MAVDGEKIEMTIRQAAEFTGRSPATIRRWRAEGVRVDDYDALMKHSDMMDMRSVGKSAILARERPDLSASKQSIRSYFPTNPDPDAFFDLPFPGDWSKANQALAILSELKAAFSNRVEELKPIKHAESDWLAASDLVTITEAHRLLSTILEAFVS
jgi:hypothetical protein